MKIIRKNYRAEGNMRVSWIPDGTYLFILSTSVPCRAMMQTNTGNIDVGFEPNSNSKSKWNIIHFALSQYSSSAQWVITLSKRVYALNHPVQEQFFVSSAFWAISEMWCGWLRLSNAWAVCVWLLSPRLFLVFQPECHLCSWQSTSWLK